MNQNQMKEEIQLIKKMVEKTKKTTAEAWQLPETIPLLSSNCINGFGPTG